ncbi:MAG: hypothetical protein AB7F35_23390 [Acetobacteraceae bacterium]
MSRFPSPATALCLAFALQAIAVPAYSAAISSDTHAAPAKAEAIPGSALKRLTLTDKAAQRLEIRTGQITQDASGKRVAPYPALIYDLAGDVWVYTSPSPLTFVRQKIVVEQVKGDAAYLLEGPPEGTAVVIVGVAELYGTERGVGH